MKKESKSPLPISLQSVEISNYAGIIKTGLDGLPGDAQWIFLTGENGFGKTSVLQGIATALSNTSEGKGEKFKVEISSLGQELKFDGTGRATAALPQFAAYGASRIEIAHDASSNEATDKSGRLYSLFRSDGVLLSIEAEMKIWEQRNPTYFNHLKNTLLQVLDQNIGDIFIENENAKVMYVELDNAGEPLPAVSFGQLASAYRSIIAMIGDLLIRFYKIYPKDTPPAEFAGIVLIDELDVHLHPKMQRRLPGILSGVFPKMQFIASIHSPIPILGAPENAVFLKVLRSKEAGITLHNLDSVQVRSLTPDTLLSSPIFDFEEIISDQYVRGKDRLVTAGSFKEASFDAQLEQRLKEMAQAANIDPKLFSK
jgi:predicted ATP-binding protein involved in virulence